MMCACYSCALPTAVESLRIRGLQNSAQGHVKVIRLCTCVFQSGTQAPMGTHFYIYDYQVKSTAFFNILSELHNGSSIHTLYLQCFISTELHSVRLMPQTNK